MKPILTSSRRELRISLGAKPFVLVPTMGALHDGHIWLIDRARRHNLPVVVSIFINPLQFDSQSDLATYPRNLEQDLHKLKNRVFAVYAPSVDEIYPNGLKSVSVNSGPLGQILEGYVRPGFFDGVLTVVAKLLLQTTPEMVFFSKKDAQQAFLVRRMVEELAIPVAVEITGFLRDEFSLPYSSRNVRLDEDEKLKAQKLSQGLLSVVTDRPLSVQCCLDKMLTLADSLDVELDYAQIVDKNFVNIDSDRIVERVIHDPEGSTGIETPLFLIATRLRRVRIIDNVDLVVK